MTSRDDGRPLRILFVNSGLGYGGAETQLLETVRELRRRGHRPHVYLLTRVAPRANELKGLDIPVHIDEKRGRLDVRVIARIRRYVLDHDIDVIHGFLFDANVYVRLAGLGTGVPVFNAERSSDYQLSKAQWVAHVLTRRFVNGVIANTHAGRAFAARQYALPDFHTHVTWNGIDLAQVDQRCGVSTTDYRQLFFEDRSVRIATFVGSINPSKDHALALAVADALTHSDPSWRVLFVGASFDGTHFDYKVAAVGQSNELAAAIEAQRRSLRHADKIRFVGRRSDALEIVAASDVLFSTSVREGFPNAVLEAMSVGTPVVSTNYSDIKLILGHDEWVIDSRDPNEMAAAIRRAEASGADIGRQLRRWVEEHATIERSVDALLDVYRPYLRAEENS